MEHHDPLFLSIARKSARNTIVSSPFRLVSNVYSGHTSSLTCSQIQKKAVAACRKLNLLDISQAAQRVNMLGAKTRIHSQVSGAPAKWTATQQPLNKHAAPLSSQLGELCQLPPVALRLPSLSPQLSNIGHHSCAIFVLPLFANGAGGTLCICLFSR